MDNLVLIPEYTIRDGERLFFLSLHPHLQSILILMCDYVDEVDKNIFWYLLSYLEMLSVLPSSLAIK